MTILENELKNKNNIVGADEVGYGSIAGPLVVCGIKADKDWKIEGLNDSKKLSEKKRLLMNDKLMKLVSDSIIEMKLVERSNNEIDKFGLGVVHKSCYEEIYLSLYDDNSVLIADGNIRFPNLTVQNINVFSVIKADTLVPSVMAASIIAKTYRDKKMREYHLKYPQYDWINNVGYYGADGLHIAAIKKYGYSPLHRLSYKLKVFAGMNIPVNP